MLLWALLALFTVGSGQTPPFQLAALSFAVGGVIGLLDMARRGASPLGAFAQPIRVWALGVFGLFGYHFCYFTALRNAPAAEASLIAYLWPLLIVLFSGLLPRERLRAGHAGGALVGFAGAAVIILAGGDAEAPAGGDPAIGFVAAGVGALLWAGYSVLNRVAGAASTDAVAGFCLAAAALSAVCHAALETTVWPESALEWASVLGLGLGPVGLAFYTWDYGCKRGDIQLLGVSSYAAPLLSTVILIAAGVAPASLALLGGAGLIVAGSLLAARASFSAHSTRRRPATVSE